MSCMGIYKSGHVISSHALPDASYRFNFDSSKIDVGTVDGFQVSCVAFNSVETLVVHCRNYTIVFVCMDCATVTVWCKPE